MATPLTVEHRQDGPAATVVLTGELDLAGNPQLRSIVQRCLDDATITAVTIDLAKVTFIDSSGIGTLISCLHRADSVAKTLRVRGATGQVATVLDMTGVTPMLTGTDDRHAAEL